MENKLKTKSIQMDQALIDAIETEMIKNKTFSFQEMARRLINEALENRQARKEGLKHGEYCQRTV